MEGGDLGVRVNRALKQKRRPTMAFRANRDAGRTGPNPGLTPIDDIHGNNPTVGIEPHHASGRMAGRDEEEDRAAKTKKEKRSKKSS
jgi:hypothetical protein